jgi:hypothetical protein
MPTETKKVMEGSEKYQTVSRSWVYKCYKRFSEGVCDIKDGERTGRPPLSKDNMKSYIHDITTTVLGGVSKSSVLNFLTEDFDMSHVCVRLVPRFFNIICS